MVTFEEVVKYMEKHDELILKRKKEKINEIIKDLRWIEQDPPYDVILDFVDRLEKFREEEL